MRGDVGTLDWPPSVEGGEGEREEGCKGLVWYMHA